MRKRLLWTRSFYCSRVGRKVTLLEYSSYTEECEGTCGLMSCSDQERCAMENARDGVPVYPWSRCPSCLERSRPD